MLVFFDDILIYSVSWAKHLQHVRAVLELMSSHNLFLKRSKCTFVTSSVSYLDHIISVDGVAMDSDKVQVVVTWPTQIAPRSVRGLCGFLGLAGYYHKFIKDFGAIATPLTLLLKNGFRWTNEAAVQLQALKDALSSGPVLQLPDFDKVRVPWHSSAGRSRLAMPSSPRISAN